MNLLEKIDLLLDTVTYDNSRAIVGPYDETDFVFGMKYKKRKVKYLGIEWYIYESEIDL